MNLASHGLSNLLADAETDAIAFNAFLRGVCILEKWFEKSLLFFV
jgi:hypothetical protein